MKTHLLSVLTIIVIVANFAIQQSAQAEEVSGRKKIDILNTTGIRFFLTDSTGKGLNPNLGFQAKERRSKGTKCYWCTGTPKTCQEIECGEILVIETND